MICSHCFFSYSQNVHGVHKLLRCNGNGEATGKFEMLSQSFIHSRIIYKFESGVKYTSCVICVGRIFYTFGLGSEKYEKKKWTAYIFSVAACRKHMRRKNVQVSKWDLRKKCDERWNACTGVGKAAIKYEMCLPPLCSSHWCVCKRER